MSDSTDLERAVSRTVEDPTARLAGKYLMFEVAQETYGLHILDVREIDSVMPITRLPGGPPYVRGVIDLRGRVTPVIDLRARLGMSATVASDQTMVIVVQGRAAGRAGTVGLLVDRVLEVVALEASGIELPPDLTGSSAMADLLVGVAKLPSRLVFLLDVASLLNAGAPVLEAAPSGAELPTRAERPS